MLLRTFTRLQINRSPADDVQFQPQANVLVHSQNGPCCRCVKGLPSRSGLSWRQEPDPRARILIGGGSELFDSLGRRIHSAKRYPSPAIKRMSAHVGTKVGQNLQDQRRVDTLSRALCKFLKMQKPVYDLRPATGLDLSRLS